MCLRDNSSPAEGRLAFLGNGRRETEGGGGDVVGGCKIDEERSWRRLPHGKALGLLSQSLNRCQQRVVVPENTSDNQAAVERRSAKTATTAVPVRL